MSDPSPRMSKRGLLAGLPAIAAAFTVADVAQAAEAPAGSGTWDRIMATGVLRSGVANTEPFFFKDITKSSAPGGVVSGDAMWRGIGTGISKAVADGMGVKLELVETSWPNIVASLQANQFDVMFLLDGTPKRALALDFVPVPSAWYAMAVLAGDDFKLATWEAMNDPGVKISVVQGSSPEEFVRGRLPKATVTSFQESSAAYAALQAGRVDAVGGVAPELDLVKAKLGGGKVIVPKPAFGYPGSTGIRYEPNNRFKDYLVTALNYLYYSGKIEDIYAEYMTFRGLDASKIIPIMREQWT